MASGKIIMSWQSKLNYQFSKMVPQLPVLAVGRRYRLYLKGQEKPAGTMITRLIFRNIQGDEIKQLNLEGHDNEFVFPEGTVDYELQLINAGCTHLEFDRIEICTADLPKDVHDDLWLQDPITDYPDKPVHLLVMSAGKRAKRDFPWLKRLAGDLAVQIMLVSWQHRDDVGQDITDLLKENRAYNTHIISCEPRFDRAVIDACNSFPAFQGLVTNRAYLADRPQNIYRYVWRPNVHQLKEAVSEPDWVSLFSVIHAIWGGDQG
jgi:accessory Sec system protein Asp3